MAADRRAELERILSILEDAAVDERERRFADAVRAARSLEDVDKIAERARRATPHSSYSDRRRYHQERAGSFEYDLTFDANEQPSLSNAVFRIVDIPNPPEAQRISREEERARYRDTGRRYSGWMLKIACPSCRGNVDMFFPDEAEHSEMRRDLRRQYGEVPPMYERLMAEVEELRNKLLDAEEERQQMETEADELMAANDKLERDLEEALDLLEEEALTMEDEDE